jgi:hypothetical protein
MANTGPLPLSWMAGSARRHLIEGETLTVSARKSCAAATVHCLTLVFIVIFLTGDPLTSLFELSVESGLS